MELKEESKLVVSLGHRIVMDNGPAMCMFANLNPKEQIKMQPLNKRMQHHMSQKNMEPVPFAKDSQQREFLVWRANNKYDVKRVENVQLNGFTGSYQGEI